MHPIIPNSLYAASTYFLTNRLSDHYRSYIPQPLVGAVDLLAFAAIQSTGLLFLNTFCAFNPSVYAVGGVALFFLANRYLSQLAPPINFFPTVRAAAS